MESTVPHVLKLFKNPTFSDMPVKPGGGAVCGRHAETPEY